VTEVDSVFEVPLSFIFLCHALFRR
jgi:hypothetical protein